jgi:hypothetical protein
MRDAARSIALFVTALGALGACDDRGARVAIDGVAVGRAPDGAVIVDVDVLGVERGGGNVGAYCVTVHHLIPGVNPAFLTPRVRYREELEYAEACAMDLRDGDTRTYRFVSTRLDLASGAPVRVQARVSRDLDIEDARVP